MIFFVTGNEMAGSIFPSYRVEVWIGHVPYVNADISMQVLAMMVTATEE